MYYIQAAPFVSFLLVTFRILQRWIIEFKVARGEDVYDPAHPERNTPESFIHANADMLEKESNEIESHRGKYTIWKGGTLMPAALYLLSLSCCLSSRSRYRSRSVSPRFSLPFFDPSFTVGAKYLIRAMFGGLDSFPPARRADVRLIRHHHGKGRYFQEAV